MSKSILPIMSEISYKNKKMWSTVDPCPTCIPILKIKVTFCSKVKIKLMWRRKYYMKLWVNKHFI